MNSPTEARWQLCLNGDWLRRAGGGPEAVPAEGWEVVRVPEYALSAAAGSAWFRLDYRVPVVFGGEGRRVLLRFVRVRHFARVFVNGVKCGENHGARAPFEVDVTGALRPGESNRIEVWVHACDGGHAMPGRTLTDEETIRRLTTFMGYRAQATIAEDVLLISRPELHVSDVLVIPSVRRQTLTARLTVANDSARERRLSLSSTVFLGDTEALRLPVANLRLAAGESRTISVSAPWAEPRLWGSPPYGEPVLYHLETCVQDEPGSVTDRLVTRFGFREIWTEGDQVFLNGRKLRLLGYWVPEGSGRTQWTLRMAALRAIGCNTIHNHTEQREPAFYDVADELGMLVWDADYCGGPLGTCCQARRDPFPEVLAELSRQYPAWARTVANHPSVVVLMMECLFTLEAARQLGQVYRTADPTRLLHASYGFTDPLDAAAYACAIRMDHGDPLDEVHLAYCERGRPLQIAAGRAVPLFIPEVYYMPPPLTLPEPPPNEEIAKATFEAIGVLAGHDVAGVNFFHQHAFRNESDLAVRIEWPSRSGEGQHTESVLTGGRQGQEFINQDFVNLHDRTRPAFEVRPVGQAIRAAGASYLGYEVERPVRRRPEVMIRMTRAGVPVPDAAVFAMPRQGTVSLPTGMRTDRDGLAWFQLRDPGRYRFHCLDEGGAAIELDCMLEFLDEAQGGPRAVRLVELPLDRRS